MKPIDEILTTYFRAWNEPEHTSELIERTCAPNIYYVDPRYTCRSASELAARIGDARTEAPVFQVDITSAIDGYGDTYRYTWLFVVPAMSLSIPGLDVVVRGADGRLATLTSFFGALGAIEPGSPLRVQPRWGA